ncbi:MAG: class II aldolase/adducin family protein [Thermoanaerobaculia bacterium]|nr:class II aldolase/adducin family protein [Thermoanaerobaculia bacterium]
MEQEGAIKFQAEHRHERLEPRFGELSCRLAAWREILVRTSLVGQDPALYGGFGYGNVSARVGPPSAARGRRAFLITGTQTSGRACMSLEDFCLVERCAPARNQVESRGLVLPSSESMTHGAIYDLAPQVRFVFHAHTPVLWRRARALRLPTTDAQVPYGTPEMAREVERLYRSSVLPSLGVFAMGGHEDGIVAFGKSAEQTGEVLLRFLARAFELACAEQNGVLCSV